MERKITFREYQEQVAADHNNLQDFARASFDHLVDDVVTKSNRYAGFAVVKSAQAEVSVAVGRFYQAGGAVFNKSSTVTQSMVPYLAAAAKRIVAVSVYGVENDTEVEERDFLINTQTGETEPDAVTTVQSRDAVLVFTTGAESADPQPPAIPNSHAVIAHILVDNLQVISVSMQNQNAVSSTEGLDLRTRSLETFRSAIEPRVTAIASDVASLANQVAQRGDNRALIQLYRDVARVKEALEIPADASDYGADRFLDTTDSDVDDSQSLGFDALVQEGIRFPADNASVAPLTIFAANDPNAALSSGLLLPAYDSILKMEIGPYHSDLGIAQYGFQTFDVVQRTVSRQRLRYGPLFTVCTNAAWWLSGSYDPVTQTFQRDGETFQVLNPEVAQINHRYVRLRQVWTDTYSEEYWDSVVIEHSITGAQVAQTFLAGNDIWMTRFGFYCTVKAANEAVFLTVCEVTNGVPDLSKAVLQQTIAHTDLLANAWIVVNTQPTFLKAGKRYAAVLTSNANHRFGFASGQNYLDGTFFYSTDGSYFQGDLTKDLMIQVWGAKFRAPQVTIELGALSLSGGIQSIDILAGMVVPESTNLVYEVQPGGSGGEWRPLTADDLDALSTVPALCRFRARFVGTRDMMPAIQLTGSEVRLSRPKLALTHISEPQTLATASDEIVVEMTLEDFNETPHDLTCRLRVGAAWETPDATVTELMDAAAGRYRRRFTFNLGAATSSFSIETKGTTNSASNTFHVAERVYYAIA